MKKIAYLLMIVALAFGQACEGPEGPEGAPGPEGPTGPQGPAGPAGTSSVAKVVEFGVDLEIDDDGDYSFYLPFEEFEAEGLVVAESDVVLLYRFRGIYDPGSGPVLIWSPMPQSVYLPQGILQYDYIHTFLEVLIYIDSSFDLATLSAEARNALILDQGFRLVVLPGEFLNGRVAKKEIDFTDYAAVAKHFNIKESDVKKVKLK